MNRALFLDRDGVINLDHNYVHKRENFDFMEGIFELCKAAQDKGYKLIVVTNQAGIGRGYYSEEDFQELSEWMCGQFKAKGVTIDAVYHCPYHPEHGVGEYQQASEDRKPSPGMLLRAEREHQLELASSLLIGDSETDIGAARNAKLGKAILFSKDATDTDADATINRLLDAHQYF